MLIKQLLIYFYLQSKVLSLVLFWVKDIINFFLTPFFRLEPESDLFIPEFPVPKPEMELLSSLPEINCNTSDATGFCLFTLTTILWVVFLHNPNIASNLLSFLLEKSSVSNPVRGWDHINLELAESCLPALCQQNSALNLFYILVKNGVVIIMHKVTLQPIPGLHDGSQWFDVRMALVRDFVKFFNREPTISECECLLFLFLLKCTKISPDLQSQYEIFLAIGRYTHQFLDCYSG